MSDLADFRATFLGLGLCFAALPAGAQQLAWAPAHRLEMVYDVTAGAKIVELTLEFAIVGDSYQIASRQASVGVLRMLFPWDSRTEVVGRFVDATTQPVSYRVKGEFRGKPRSVEMDFRDGDLVRHEVFPDNRDDERDEVTPEQRLGAIDPVSAVMAVIRQMNEGKGCEARVPVFDGRMRYDIQFRDLGKRDVPKNYASIFAGEAEVCEFNWIPISGRSRRQGLPRNADEDKRGGRAFMAALGPGGAMAPARIEFEAWFGTIVGHLREVRSVPQKAAVLD